MHGGSDDEGSEAARQAEARGRDLFVVHKLSKLDTLAGLAVRYHVTVADIKRSNSLLSDSAMFARDSLLIPTRPLPMGHEYSAWAGMIVAQYGQITRGAQERPGRCSFGAPAEPRLSAIEQLRAHYGLSPASSPTSATGRNYAHSEDGFASGRPGEVEMHDMSNSLQGLPRRPSLPELNGYAGEPKGPPPGDERLRRRTGREGDDAWPSSDSGPSGSQSGHILPPAGSSSPERARRRPPLFQSPDTAAPGRGAGGQGLVPRQGSCGVPLPPGRRRESFLDKIKRAASQPALAAPSGPSLASLADTAIASVKRAPPQLGTRGLLHDAAAALQGPKDTAKRE